MREVTHPPTGWVSVVILLYNSLIYIVESFIPVWCMTFGKYSKAKPFL